MPSCATFSLDDRPTFEDVTLAELALGMPEYRKNREGPTDFKPFLKEALRPWLPDSVLYRSKKGLPYADDQHVVNRLRQLVGQVGLPFNLDLTDEQFNELGDGELQFLYSTQLWLDSIRP